MNWNEISKVNDKYPVTSDAEKKMLRYFAYRVAENPLNLGKPLKVPRRWLPRGRYFKDEVFLSVVGLSSTLSQENTLSMLSQEIAGNLCKEEERREMDEKRRRELRESRS